MAKKKKTQEQPGVKITKVPAKRLNIRKTKKPVVGEKPCQTPVKDNLAGLSAARPKDLPPTEMAKLSTDASNKSPGVKPSPEAKAEVKTDVESKTPSDLTPQLVKRVHELYEELGREEVRAVQDWDNTQGKFKNLKPNRRLNLISKLTLNPRSKPNLNPKLKPNLQRIAKPSLRLTLTPNLKPIPRLRLKTRIQRSLNLRPQMNLKPILKRKPRTNLNRMLKPKQNLILKQVNRKIKKKVNLRKKVIQPNQMGRN